MTLLVLFSAVLFIYICQLLNIEKFYILTVQKPTTKNENIGSNSQLEEIHVVSFDREINFSNTACSLFSPSFFLQPPAGHFNPYHARPDFVGGISLRGI